jgi:hypothetical protein
VENLSEDVLKPLTISKKRAYRYVGIPSLVQAWMYHTRRGHGEWVEIVREGGRGCETLLDRRSVEHAYELYKQGIKPPPIPSRRQNPPESEELES